MNTTSLAEQGAAVNLPPIFETDFGLGRVRLAIDTLNDAQLDDKFKSGFLDELGNEINRDLRFLHRMRWLHRQNTGAF